MNRYLRMIINFLVDPQIRFGYLSACGFYNWMPDELYLKKEFKIRMGKELNLDDPQTFNEKLQWLKIHDRKPEYTEMVDKYAAKQYVADRIGEQYIIPTLGVWEHFDDIDFDNLPNQFVLKCTHDSGGLIICKDKRKLDKVAAKKKLEKCLKRNYYWAGREWPYRDVPPRIIAEKYMVDNDEVGKDESLKDYKFYCFNGKTHYLYVSNHMDDHLRARLSFADSEWKKTPFGRTDYTAFDKLPEKPENFEKMKRLAEELSKEIPFLRVDLYEVNKRIYFGEMTFHPRAGFMPFKPEEWDGKLGELVILPNKSGGYLICNEGYTLWIHAEFDYQSEKEDLRDYKFYCFDGVMKFVMINSDRNSDKPTKADYFDRDFNWLDFTWGYEHAACRPKKPDGFDEMIAIAEKLAQGLPHVRVDLYECNGHIYFGELTFFDGSGFDKIEPIEWEYRIGEMLILPSKKR